MNPLSMAPSFAGQMLDLIVVCLVEGIVLAAAVSLLLKFIPLSTQNSRTRFALWFSTLMAIVALPALRGEWRAHDAGPTAGGALITISSSWAVYIVFFWAVAAILGLIRVAASLWSLRRLRRRCTEIPTELLSAELRSAITSFRKSRPLSILVSNEAQVPSAIGFLHPAIVLPAWLMEDPSAPELKYAVMHELAHLERWDDWSNLAQKLVKAVLFFHPGVWWIERNLSLEREKACDDAVVARSGNARIYAQCLARLAEKSFLRRQLALAQAAVDRMSHLSQRVASILDDRRPRSIHLWKPALPLVTVFSVVGAISVSQAPELVRISSGSNPTIASRNAARPLGAEVDAARISGREVSLRDSGRIGRPANSAMDSQSEPALVTNALFTIPSAKRTVKLPSHKDATRPRRARNLSPELTAASIAPAAAPTTPAEASDVVVVFVSNQIVAQREVDDMGAQIVRVNVWQVRWIIPAKASSKPIPRKT